MKVPSYNAATVRESAAPVPQQSASAPSAAFGAPIAQGLANAGQAMQQFQDDADNLRVQDAYNQLRERQLDLSIGPQDGYANVKGRDVLAPRKDGKSMSADYVERFGGIGTELEGSLANERQKAKFRQKFADSALDFRSGLQRHESQQISEYSKTVTNATVALETDAAMKAFIDPSIVDKTLAIDKSITNITESLRAQGMREGLPADALKVVIADKVSKVHSGVLMAAIEKQNLQFADDYLKKYGADMDAADILKYKGAIDKEMRTNEAVAVAHTVWNGARQAVDPNDYERLTYLVAGQESGNKERDSNGNLITSPKGAQGKMQVMPATNKNPGYGVKPAQDDSDAERTRVGRDYLQAMLKEYRGDVSLALAAYNAGPGAVDKALKDAGKHRDGNGNYLDYLPKETRDYVASITAKYSTGTGGKPRVTLEDVQEGVRQQMAGKPAAQVKIAIDQVTQLFETNQKAKKQREEETVAEAYKQLDANGGDFSQLPASIRTALPGDKIDNLQTYAKQRAKGQEAVTDWSEYYALRSDPRYLKDANLGAVKHLFADSEFKQLVTEQESLRKDPGGHVTPTHNASQILKSYLSAAGIDPTPKPNKNADSDAAKVGRAMRAQQELITAEETAKGRKLTPDEVDKVTAKLFTNVQVKGSWFGTNAKPRFDVLPTDEIAVPEADRAQIVAALQATRRPVSEAMILEMYARKNNLTR